MSTARTTSPRTAPTDLPTWAIQAEDLEAMLATDDDTVDTAVIPRLAYREAVEEAAVPGQTIVTEPADEVEHVAAPVGHNLRRRHASPESVAAIRRNLIAVACVLAAVVLIGAAATWLAGWIALGVWTLLVVAGAIAIRRSNSRYTARHSRYTPRHA
ncbi:hypothetical protein B277_13079 [Janibacter hoylei PVAS-1]|uniref:Uncharacterized protein n=1 Tax=Janibacter hoylei PVAS-1 TaxID=1210046 RepID=K1E064_9MICO|nr:hypothetical protein [Janibacter hoylei]EKA60416.1 hypothetical protein B277_13079 [Janibacter hoylei PVAS-1]RWU84253.1 hypothetical protein CWN80_05340 [Janibacter hoylei PVAS-1]